MSSIMSSTPNSPFQVDIILQNLKELQNEKSCLEAKLADLKSKHHQLEMANDIANQKHLQLSDTHHRMEENLKVAQLKVSQTQCLSESLDSTNAEVRKKIGQLEDSMETEKGNREKNIKSFEQSLSTIRDNLDRAKSFYSHENLAKERTTAEMMEVNLQAELDSQNHEVSAMVKAMNELNITKQSLTSTDSLGEDERRVVWEMNIAYKDTIKQRLDPLKTSASHLTSQATQLKQDISQISSS